MPQPKPKIPYYISRVWWEVFIAALGNNGIQGPIAASLWADSALDHLISRGQIDPSRD